MARKARDPIMVALILFVLLMIALILYLAAAAIDRYAKGKMASPTWTPPGWIAPSSPPPAISK